MTLEQALENLYTGARTVQASADVHDQLKISYQILLEALKPKDA